MVPASLFFLFVHVVVISLSLACISTSLLTPPLPLLFFLFLHPSFLPSGSPGWCDAGCQSQGYMWYRVGGGGPGVWALWQRQQVLQLPDVCLYPQICPLDTSHFLPKYISESFLLSIPLSLSTASRPNLLLSSLN